MSDTPENQQELVRVGLLAFGALFVVDAIVSLA